jgi:hypothetical protein
MIWNETSSPITIVMFEYFPSSHPLWTLSEKDVGSIRYDIGTRDELGEEIQYLSVPEKIVSDQPALIKVYTSESMEESRTVHLHRWPRTSFLYSMRLTACWMREIRERSKQTGNALVILCHRSEALADAFIALDFLLHELEEGSLDHVSDDHDPIFGVFSDMLHQGLVVMRDQRFYGFVSEVMRFHWYRRYSFMKWQGHEESRPERPSPSPPTPGGVD